MVSTEHSPRESLAIYKDQVSGLLDTMIPLLPASESIETSHHALAFGMVSHVEMAPAAGACTGAAGFKLFGKVITQQQPMHASTDATGSPPSKLQPAPPIFSSGRGSVDQQEEAARARAAAAEARLPCPRCRSRDTKFCYFNNYNVNQPRHFCRACHRYWTAGGVLRNVPVGSGRRKNRPVPHAAATSSADHRSEGSVSPGLTLGFPPDHGWSHAAPSLPAPCTGHGDMEQYRWLVRTERPPVGSGHAF